MRLEFDMTVDDAVDLNLRGLRRSKTFRSIRARAIWTPALISGPAVLATWILSSGSPPNSTVMWAIGGIVAVVFSVVAYFLGRWFYDWTVSRRIRRIVLEQFGKADSVRCEIELRPAELWTRQDGTEITLPWADLEDVVDTNDGIELRFRNGLVLARTRVFASPGQRAAFLAWVKGALSESNTTLLNS
jgi:hypothetical protein